MKKKAEDPVLRSLCNIARIMRKKEKDLVHIILGVVLRVTFGGKRVR